MTLLKRTKITPFSLCLSVVFGTIGWSLTTPYWLIGVIAFALLTALGSLCIGLAAHSPHS